MCDPLKPLRAAIRLSTKYFFPPDGILLECGEKHTGDQRFPSSVYEYARTHT
jgi:hypothetical protein